jgi:hypothetical protein
VLAESPSRVVPSRAWVSCRVAPGCRAESRLGVGRVAPSRVPVWRNRPGLWPSRRAQARAGRGVVQPHGGPGTDRACAGAGRYPQWRSAAAAGARSGPAAQPAARRSGASESRGVHGLVRRCGHTSADDGWLPRRGGVATSARRRRSTGGPLPSRRRRLATLRLVRPGPGPVGSAAVLGPPPPPPVVPRRAAARRRRRRNSARGSSHGVQSPCGRSRPVTGRPCLGLAWHGPVLNLKLRVRLSAFSLSWTVRAAV